MTKENKLTAGTRLKQIYTEGSFEDDLGAVVKARLILIEENSKICSQIEQYIENIILNKSSNHCKIRYEIQMHLTQVLMLWQNCIFLFVYLVLFQKSTSTSQLP